jgi:uncharacterized protein
MIGSKYRRFVILLNQIQGVETTEGIIRDHIQFLQQLEKNEQLELCGPFSDYEGGMLVIKANSVEEARDIAESDPFVKTNVRTYELRTWELSCEENNHLGMG